MDPNEHAFNDQQHQVLIHTVCDDKFFPPKSFQLDQMILSI